MRGATAGHYDDRGRVVLISIHAPHAGRDKTTHIKITTSSLFQSTRPMRGATSARVPTAHPELISIHAPHAGRDKVGTYDNVGGYIISIHAPHAGRDAFTVKIIRDIFSYFNPRAPCGARPAFFQAKCTNVHISIHAPHAGRDQAERDFQFLIAISIHAPHAGRDLQSANINARTQISIHAPHAGRDIRPFTLVTVVFYFNPRAPCGARLRLSIPTNCGTLFQSTRPMRGATGSLLAADAAF